MSGLRVSAHVANLEEFTARLKKLSKAVRAEALENAALAGATVVEGYARANVNSTFSSKSSNSAGLAGSIRSEIIEKSDKKAVAAVGPSVVYGAIHELGGVIQPVTAKALVFQTSDGEWVTTGIVHMPARPYLRPALEQNKDEVNAAIGTQIKKAIEGA